MLNVDSAADEVVDFLEKHGYCPEKVSRLPVAVTVMAAWIKGDLTDEDVLYGLENLQILSKKNLKL